MYCAGTLEVDDDRHELRRDGAPVHLQPRSFEVLLYLVEHRERVVTKEELLDEVWGDRFVTQSALSTCIKEIRSVVGDTGKDQHVVRTLHGKGYRWLAETVEGERGAAAPAPQPPGRLARRRVELFGRETMRRTLADALRDHPLVTVVGPGGAGKTALALDLAGSVGEDYPGGVHVCELAAIDSETLSDVVYDVVSGGAAGAAGTPEEGVADALGREPCLLVLDNCEHLIEAAAKFTSRLLDLSDNVTFLATSREALDIRGEHVLRIAGLDWQDERAPALEMFFARSHDVSFPVPDDEETRDLVREIVRSVDGLPLAIEMAAARLTSATPAELLTSLGESLPQLGSARRFDERQSTIGRTVAWSYDLLSDRERPALVDLGFFAGSFTAEAARAVLGEDPQHPLHRLVEQSMVTTARTGTTTRFRLYEPTRQFVAPRLADDRRRVLAERHARYFAELAGVLAEAMWTADAPAAAVRLSEEWIDLGRALAWGREHRDPTVALEPLLALGMHLQSQLRPLGFAWLEAAVEVLPDEAGRTDVTALRAVGRLMAHDMDACRALVQALPQSALSRLARMLYGIVGGDPDMLLEAHRGIGPDTQLSEGPHWSRMAHSQRLIALALTDPTTPEGPAMHEAVERELASSEAPTVTLWQLLSLLTYEVRTERWADAGRLRHEIDQVANDSQCRWFSAIASGVAGTGNAAGEDPEEAIRVALDRARAVRDDDRTSLPWALRSLVIALRDSGRPALAAVAIGVVEATSKLSVVEVGTAASYDSVAHEVRTRDLDADKAARLVTEGAALSPRELVERIERELSVSR